MNRSRTSTEQCLRAYEEFNERALRLGLGDLSKYLWYHTVELGQNLVTPGVFDFRASLPCFQFPEDMHGMAALDVGSATGFFAFEFERRGARVVAVELPSLEALDRFPGQTVEQSVQKMKDMFLPDSAGRLKAMLAEYTSEELYYYLLEAPFDLCRRFLGSNVTRCFSTVYDLSERKLGMAGFDLVFMGDILLHTLNPLQALATVAPLCRKKLILSQVMPPAVDGQPAMLYVGGEDPDRDEISWWRPNILCLVQLLKKLGFRDVVEVGHHSGVLKSFGYAYDCPILHATK